MFKCAFLCVQSAVCQAKAVLSVGKISTVLSGMDTSIGKLVREQKEGGTEEERLILSF